jgi:hypothetical protein
MMTEPTMERRKAVRTKEETLVRFDGSDFSIYSRATDLSATGAFVATHYLLDPGTKINLNLIDPSGSEARHPAKVVRAMTQTNDRGETTIGIGVEFVSEDPSLVS